MPMGDDLAGSVVSNSGKVLQIFLELMKMMKDLARGAGTQSNSRNNAVLNEIGSGKVSQKALLENGRKLGDNVIMQGGITKKDMADIARKAKEYGIPVAFTGKQRNDNMKVSLRAGDKAVFEQIMSDIVADKMRTRPGEMTSIKLQPWEVEGLKYHLTKNDISGNIVREKGGAFHLVFDVSDKKAVEIVQKDFAGIHKSVKDGLDISRDNKYTVIKDRTSGKQISFDSIISKAALIALYKNNLGFDGTTALLAANKYAETLSATDKSKFLSEKVNPLSEINNFEQNIRLKDESVLLKDYDFYRINLKEDGLNQFVVADNAGRIATLCPNKMNRSEMNEMISSRLGIADMAIVGIIVDKAEKVNNVYAKSAEKNLTAELGDNKGKLADIGIQRLGKNDFTTTIKDEVKTYDLGDKKQAIDTMKTDFIAMGIAETAALKCASEVYRKAQLQPTEQIVRAELTVDKTVEPKTVEPQIVTDKTPEVLPETNTEMKIDREVGGTFTVKVGEDSARYDITDREKTLNQMQEDWDISREEATDVFDKAQGQDAIEETLENAPQIEKAETIQPEIKQEIPDIQAPEIETTGRKQ